MKNILHSFLFVMIFLPVAAFSQLSNAYTSDDNPSCFEKCFYEKLLQGNPKSVGDDYDLKYHRFNWNVNPAVSYIEGCVTSYFVTKVANFSHVKFELGNAGMTVDSVVFGGVHKTFSHALDVLDINLATTFGSGHFDSIKVYYHGNPAAGGFGSFIQTTHGSPAIPVIWTLSEPFGAKDWWPCKNLLSDKIDSIDVYVKTPSAYRVASNGILVSEVTAGSNKIYHWKHRYPIAAYLVAIAVTNFMYYTDKVPMGGGDTLDMLNYVYPEDVAAAMAGTAAQVPVLQLYNSLFGDYPFKNEKYGQCEFGWGGGMEHQTMSFVVNFTFDLCAHEMSHQWYGDAVTCGSWHHIWVNEGFATYCQALSTEYLNSSQWYNLKRSRIDDITSQLDGSVYCPDTTSVGRIFDWRLSYEKGSMVLHMIRWIIGDSAFFAGMKGIIANPQLRYAYAYTDNIRHEFEVAGGQNLTGFFNDWIYGEGYPTYGITCHINPDSSVLVTIQQTQSNTSVAYFELPVPIYFKKGLKDTIIACNNTYSGQTFTVHPGFWPDSISFDPNLWLTCKLNNFLVTGTDERVDKLAFSISPNPVDQQLEISCSEKITGNILIYDVTGRLCKSIATEGRQKVSIDAGELHSGIYLVKIITAHHTVTSKFFKS